MIQLTSQQAKRLVLIRQGLHKPREFGRSTKAVQHCIERLSYVQIDSISVVERAHHHTFWTRIPDYRRCLLDELQEERKVFEYWSHAAAYLPMDDYRFSLPYMNAIASGQKHWRKPDKKMMREVFNRIELEGPMRARDFSRKPCDSGKTGQWGGQKPAKLALEQLFIEGRLMIRRRDGIEKVFDLAERVLPSEVNREEPTTEEFCRYLIDRAVSAQGLVSEAEIRYLRKSPKDLKSRLAATLTQMVDEGELILLGVENSEGVYYSRKSYVDEACRARTRRQLFLLSPFDNLVIQRKRLSQIFDFDYQIECYVPEKKRVYGYFCLPILYRGELVGRLDPKACRSEQVLLVQNLSLEKVLQDVDDFAEILAKELVAYAAFNDCDQVRVLRCNNRSLKSKLSRLLS